MFNLIDELFVPGRKHTEDERNRLALTRDEEGSADPARGPIDLDSGAVTIRPQQKPAEVAEEADGPSAAEPAAVEPDGPPAAEPRESPALEGAGPSAVEPDAVEPDGLDA